MGRLMTKKGQEIRVDDDIEERFSDMCWYVMTRGYVAHSFKDKCRKFSTTVKLHRLIMEATPDQVVDHINGNKLDNRRQNLRVCTQAENCRNNRKPRQDKTSRFKGVSLLRGGPKWIAQIQIDKKKIGLGIFSTEEAAATAYNQAALIHHGEYASLNEIKKGLT